MQVVDVPLTPEEEEANYEEDVAMMFERASPIRAPKPTQTPRQSQLARSSPRRAPTSPAKSSP